MNWLNNDIIKWLIVLLINEILIDISGYFTYTDWLASWFYDWLIVDAFDERLSEWLIDLERIDRFANFSNFDSLIYSMSESK